MNKISKSSKGNLDNNKNNFNKLIACILIGAFLIFPLLYFKIILIPAIHSTYPSDNPNYPKKNMDADCYNFSQNYLYFESFDENCSAEANMIKIGVFSGLDEEDEEVLLGQISLEPQFCVYKLNSTDLNSLTINKIDVLVLADTNLSLDQINDVKKFANEGGGIFFLASENITANYLLLKELDIIQNDSVISFSSNPENSALLNPLNSSDPLVSGIQWASSPEAEEFIKITKYSTEVVPVLEGYGEGSILMFRRNNITKYDNGTYTTGRFVGFNLIYSKESNWDTQLWLYTPYFFYRTICWIINRNPANFYDWNYSPVPHTKEQIGIGIYLALLFIFAIAGFLLAKKRSKIPLEQKYKDYLEKIIQNKKLKKTDSNKNKSLKKGNNTSAIKINKKQIEIEDKKNATAIVATIKPNKKNINELNNHKNNHKIENDDEILEEVLKQKVLKNKWEEVGLHRQISSFFIQLFSGIIVAAPYLILTMYIYPRFIQPFPQTQGWVNWTSTFFAALYTVFDMGTSTALTKFFSQYRIKKPAEGIKYAQIYIWWQMITGVIQITMVSSLGIYVLGPSYLGHMTWFFVLSSLAQFPGMLNVIVLMLEAMQRFDIKITAEMILGATTTNVIKYLTIIWFRNIFRYDWRYGEAFGAGIGMVIGDYFAQMGNFIIYIIIFKKLGYSVSTLFRVDFNKDNIKEALGFGAKLVLGNVWVPLVSLLEITLISIYVLNYNAEMGYLAMMKNITSVTSLLGTFYSALMPGISEAHGNKKLKLTEYYLIEGIKWTNFILFFLLAALASAGDKILIAFAGSQWYGALKYIPLLLIFTSLEPMAWYADRVFQGTNNTKYNMIIWIIEQGTRSIFLLIIFVGFESKYLWMLYLAYIPGIAAKDIAALIFMRRKIVKFRPYWMHTFIGPLVSALILYIINKLIVQLIWSDNVFITIFTFFIILIAGLFIFVFFTSLLGAWDKNTIDEFDKALSMIKTIKIIFSMLIWMAKLGYKLCPWKEKFKVDVFEDAKKEAIELTHEKRLLII
ncbi:MAG: hypothetical protein ACTSRZ_06705 [Promethearchaeota archaeon]